VLAAIALGSAPVGYSASPYLVTAFYSRLFPDKSISRNTLDLWLKREAETGNAQAITNYQQGCRHKIRDWQKFREFVREHGDKTQAQMAVLWGESVNQQNISDALRKIGVSRKKRLTGIKSQMKRSAKSSSHN
jgi:hypothetical protein